MADPGGGCFIGLGANDACQTHGHDCSGDLESVASLRWFDLLEWGAGCCADAGTDAQSWSQYSLRVRFNSSNVCVAMIVKLLRGVRKALGSELRTEVVQRD
jgi:hypothetical protein